MGDATVSDEDVRNVRVEGNLIGTDPAGTPDRGNLSGIALFAASDSTVGGASPSSATSSPAKPGRASSSKALAAVSVPVARTTTRSGATS